MGTELFPTAPVLSGMGGLEQPLFPMLFPRQGSVQRARERGQMKASMPVLLCLLESFLVEIFSRKLIFYRKR